MDLNTRQHRRAPLDVTLHFQVHLNHRCQVDLLGSESNRVARTREVSEGGLSFLTRTYLPRRTLVELEIAGLTESGEGIAGKEPAQLLARVQRCVMVGRQPRYLVAVSFEEVAPAVRQRIARHVAATLQAEAAPAR